jgi:hypothetical protein
MRTAILASALLASACALQEIDWYSPDRPGANPHADLATCEDNARHAYPPSTGDGPPSPMTTTLSVQSSYPRCQVYGKITQCTTQFSPSLTGEVDEPTHDANSDKREHAVEACMTKRGWRKS